MKFSGLRLFLVPVAAVLVILPHAASARTLRTEYSVTVRGFTVGRAQLQAEIADGRYSIQFSGGVRGLARIFSNAETSAAVIGQVAPDGLRPDEYKHVWREDNETEAVDLHFVGHNLTEMNLDPPRRHPERYVPITEQDMAGVLDPVTAFVWAVPTGVTPDICSRTIPLVDGRRRFDILLSYNRDEPFSTKDRSFSNNTVVCSFRYQTIAGHRIGKKSDGSIKNGDGMEVWMAPAGEGYAAPARIQFISRLGPVDMVATSIKTE